MIEINLKQALELYGEAEYFDKKGVLPLEAKTRKFAIRNGLEDNTMSIIFVGRRVYQVLAKEYMKSVGEVVDVPVAEEEMSG